MKKENALVEPNKKPIGELYIPKENPIYNALLSEIHQYAATDLCILLLGETGVGKDMMAKHIHHLSGRSGSFVRVDCGELDQELLRSELFGHEKGAFTGALDQHIGKIERANNGTLFLDEIGNMSPCLQAKLLTVLDQKQIERVGSNTAIPVNFRLIAATNCHLNTEIEKKSFREDLYYRINDVELILPPLRENKDVLAQFIAHFSACLNQEYASDFTLAVSQLAELLNHDWPGNLRELRNRIKKLFFKYHFSKLKSIPTQPSPPQNIPQFNTIELIEKITITETFEKTERNISRAAKMLNMSRQCLQYKLKKYQMR